MKHVKPKTCEARVRFGPCGLRRSRAYPLSVPLLLLLLLVERLQEELLLVELLLVELLASPGQSSG